MSEPNLSLDAAAGDLRARLSPTVLAAPVILVDDETICLALMNEYFRRAGFWNVHTASNGHDALALARTIRPDVIVLDVIMPGRDGLSVCRELRSDPALHDVPVIIQSGLTGRDDRVRAFHSGASDVIGKPADQYELIARSSALIERRQLMHGLQKTVSRMSGELRLARMIQFELLPDSRTFSSFRIQHGLDIASEFRSSSEMGGDLWGVLDSGKNAILYAVDFTGHGVSAALNTIRLHTLLRTMTDPPDEPGKLLSYLNRGLSAVLPRGHFATMICIYFNTESKTFSYASAGAPTPFLCTPEGRWIAIDSSGIPLGVVEDETYETRTCDFPPGSALVLYSDALIETPLLNGKRLEEGGVLGLARKIPLAEGSQAFLFKLLEEFSSLIAAPPDDDLTAIVIRAEERD